MVWATRIQGVAWNVDFRSKKVAVAVRRTANLRHFARAKKEVNLNNGEWQLSVNPLVEKA